MEEVQAKNNKRAWPSIAGPGYTLTMMNPVRIPLPVDFVDRPRWQRWWINVLVLLRIRTVKRECCESFRKGKFACKGCATLYDKNSASCVYRNIAKVAKLREPKV